MYPHIPPCLGTDVPAMAGSGSSCILAKRDASRSCVFALHPCPRHTPRSGWDWQIDLVSEDQSHVLCTSGLILSGAPGHCVPHTIEKIEKRTLSAPYN